MRSCFTLAAVLIVALAATTADAQTAPESPRDKSVLSNILPPEPGQKVCYRRVYDAAHLRAHPKQRAVSVTFMMRVQAHDNAKETRPEDRVYYPFALGMQRRGEKRTLGTSGSCSVNGGGRIQCSVDCDAGGLSIEKATQGDAVLLRIYEPRGIKMYSDCDGGGVWVQAGADDKVFRAERVSPDLCRSLESKQLGDD